LFVDVDGHPNLSALKLIQPLLNVLIHLYTLYCDKQLCQYWAAGWISVPFTPSDCKNQQHATCLKHLVEQPSLCQSQHITDEPHLQHAIM
jgi:hypothetical protein